MKYTSTLIAVKDIEKSKRFYYNVLGLDVISDFGTNVTLAGGIALQTIDTWKDFIHKRSNEVVFQNMPLNCILKKMIFIQKGAEKY